MIKIEKTVRIPIDHASLEGNLTLPKNAKEPGTLEQVAKLASDWFVGHLLPAK